MTIKSLILTDCHSIDAYSGIGSAEKSLLKTGFLVVREDGVFVGLLVSDDVIDKRHNLVVDCLKPKPSVRSEAEVRRVFVLMREHGLSVLPVIGDDGFLGVITQSAILEYLSTQGGAFEKQVALCARHSSELNVKLYQEIADRKQTEREKEHLRLHLDAVLHGVSEAMFSVGQNLVLKSINGAAEHVCGLRQGDLDRPITELLVGCSGKCLVVLRQALKDGKKVSLPRLVCQRRKQPDSVASVIATPLLDAGGRSLGAVMTVRDDTAMVRLEKALGQRTQFRRMIGRSAAMQAIYRLIEDLAEMETTALITGETGTGKELVADAIHGASSRATYPLVKVNCAALSDTLLESEMFGHVRGAFTGAIRDREGRFQEAHGGTLFLDEIGDISPALQVRLLRVLQEKQFQRVGENRTHSVDVRIIAATNKNLGERVAQGLFREDLYYRIHVLEVRVPPLRQRKEDISLLVDYFIADFNLRFGRQVPGITESAMAALMDYHWPGNVRELAHAIEHAFVLCQQSPIDLPHLPRFFRRASDLAKEPPSDLASEAETILRALAATNGNREQAAQHIGMSRSTFFRRLKQLGLTRKNDADSPE